MDEIKTLIDFVQNIGFVGLLILLAFPKTRKFLGFNGNSENKDEEKTHGVTQEELAATLKEALTYDKPDRPALVARIPVICNDIRSIREDISWIKGKLDV